MTDYGASSLTAAVLADIDIPDAAYQKAEARYKDLGDWFLRDGSRTSAHRPRIYAQGSFRLGTVVKPLSAEAAYDIDIGCRLESGASTASHTQQQIKMLIGDELAAYRRARQIARDIEEKRRCWRLQYADDLNFHLDFVPSIPESGDRQLQLENAMRQAGSDGALASRVAKHAGAITDTSHPDYRRISANWRVSNSEGFAIWFESRMKLAPEVLLENAKRAGRASIDALPATRWRSPLQRAVQLLKRHRDVMFAGESKSAPISVIITTLAGRVYQGERTVEEAVAAILSRIDDAVNSSRPRVANPVNPAEDFADKWYDQRYANLRLEQSFFRWTRQARADFAWIQRASSTSEANDRVIKGFGLSERAASSLRSGGGLLASPVVKGALSFPPKPLTPSKPAGFA